MAMFKDFICIHRLKSSNHFVQHNKQHHRKVLLSRFHLNGHTSGFHPQTSVSTTLYSIIKSTTRNLSRLYTRKSVSRNHFRHGDYTHWQEVDIVFLKPSTRLARFGPFFWARSLLSIIRMVCCSWIGPSKWTIPRSTNNCSTIRSI